MMIGRLSYAILLTALSSVVTAQDGSGNATIPTTKMPTYSPTGKSALVLSYHVNSVVQYDISVIRLFHLK